MMAVAIAIVLVPSVYLIDAAQAQSTDLSGKKGSVKRRLPYGNHDCGRMVRDYIAARGHSAFAQTDMSDFSSERGAICAASLNRRTKDEAEAAALAGCQRGTRKWKHAYSGSCVIAASK